MDVRHLREFGSRPVVQRIAVASHVVVEIVEPDLPWKLLDCRRRVPSDVEEHGDFVFAAPDKLDFADRRMTGNGLPVLGHPCLGRCEYAGRAETALAVAVQDTIRWDPHRSLVFPPALVRTCAGPWPVESDLVMTYSRGYRHLRRAAVVVCSNSVGAVSEVSRQQFAPNPVESLQMVLGAPMLCQLAVACSQGTHD